MLTVPGAGLGPVRGGNSCSWLVWAAQRLSGSVLAGGGGQDLEPEQNLIVASAIRLVIDLLTATVLTQGQECVPVCACVFPVTVR